MISNNQPALDIHADTQLMNISDTEFSRIRELIYNRSGINLTEQKRALVVGRLQSTLKKQGFETFTQYIDWVMKDSKGQAISELINKISTNHTHFFREKEHFNYFVETALPAIFAELNSKHDKDLRLWCAACATGEEAYNIVMLLIELLGNDYTNWNAGLLATDISSRALELAKHGIYSADKLAEMPIPLKNKYFTINPDGQFAVSKILKQQITFRRFNLMNTTFPFNKPFHAIFCRNVMIYFDQETRSKLFQRLHDMLVPGGYLFIGHSESIGAQSTLFEQIIPAAYRRKN